MSVIGVITARGNSKGIPKKNIKLLSGQPLIYWTIVAAKKSKAIDKLILSTDDPEIAQIARQFGCDVPFLRPKHLATDTASSIDTLSHALNGFEEYEHVVLLQPTSPLRTAEDIDESFKLLRDSGKDTCVSVCETKIHPNNLFFLQGSSELVPVMKNRRQSVRRQDMEKVFKLNGAIYFTKQKAFLTRKILVEDASAGYQMSAERSVDIDTIDDFKLAEKLMKEKNYHKD